MQLQIEHIRTAEGSLRCRRENQFIHRSCAENPNGGLVGGCGWVGRNNQTNTRSRGPEGDIRTSEEGALCSTLRRGALVIGRQAEAGNNGWQIKQALLFAPYDDSHPRRKELGEHCSCAVQAIQANQDVREWHTEPARIVANGLT